MRSFPDLLTRKTEADEEGELELLLDEEEVFLFLLILFGLLLLFVLLRFLTGLFRRFAFLLLLFFRRFLPETLSLLLARFRIFACFRFFAQSHTASKIVQFRLI